jgi:hypothetical protein
MTAITQPNQIALFQLLAQKSAFRLELAGMKGRGRSMHIMIKEKYGFKGNRQAVYTQFCEYVEKKKGEL